MGAKGLRDPVLSRSPASMSCCEGLGKIRGDVNPSFFPAIDAAGDLLSVLSLMICQCTRLPPPHSPFPTFFPLSPLYQPILLCLPVRPPKIAQYDATAYSPLRCRPTHREVSLFPRRMRALRRVPRLRGLAGCRVVCLSRRRGRPRLPAWLTD